MYFDEDSLSYSSKYLLKCVNLLGSLISGDPGLRIGNEKSEVSIIGGNSDEQAAIAASFGHGNPGIKVVSVSEATLLGSPF